MEKRKIKIHYSCSNYKHHDHKYKFTAYLCGRLQYVLAKLKNDFCVSSVVRRFYLQQGDTVIVFSQGMYKYTEAIGFECFGMVSTNIPGFVPCAPGLFYGVGYSDDGTRYITVKKMWHYRPAVACEWLRLKLPFNAGKYIFGF